MSSSLEVERREEGRKGVGGEGGRGREEKKESPFLQYKTSHHRKKDGQLYEIQITSKAEINSKSKIIRK